jgi:hypothetical protein
MGKVFANWNSSSLHDDAVCARSRVVMKLE